MALMGPLTLLSVLPAILPIARLLPTIPTALTVQGREVLITARPVSLVQEPMVPLTARLMLVRTPQF